MTVTNIPRFQDDRGFKSINLRNSFCATTPSLQPFTHTHKKKHSTAVIFSTVVLLHFLATTSVTPTPHYSTFRKKRRTQEERWSRIPCTILCPFRRAQHFSHAYYYAELNAKYHRVAAAARGFIPLKDVRPRCPNKISKMVQNGAIRNRTYTRLPFEYVNNNEFD